MRLLKDLASEAVNPYAWYVSSAVAFIGFILMNICAALVD